MVYTTDNTGEVFPIDAAQLVAMFTESVFYGTSLSRMFLITFVGCIRMLIWREGRFKLLDHVNWKMFGASVLMFIFATMDVAFVLQHNMDAFIYADDPVKEFTNISDWVNVMKMVCYVGQTFVGDFILLYRCWIIYSKRWLIVAGPIVFWLAGTVCGIMTIYEETAIDVSADLLNINSIEPWITSMLALTLVTNVVTTAFMVHRIWSIRRHVKHKTTYSSNSSPLKNIMIILIESGLMYTLSIIILFVLYMASNNGQYAVSNAVVQIIGITFNLIITSVDRGEATQPSNATPTTGPNSVPMHVITIQTTVTTYPPEDSELESSRNDPSKASPHSDITRHGHISDGEDPYKTPIDSQC